jgi:phage shock protein A
VKRRALRRRYGRSTATADVLFHDAEAAFRAGRDALARGDAATARAEAQRVGSLGLRAQREGLDLNKYGKLLRAQAMLIERAS